MLIAPVSAQPAGCQQAFIEGDTLKWKSCLSGLRPASDLRTDGKSHYRWLLGRYGLLATVITEQGYTDPLIAQLERLEEATSNLVEAHPGVAPYLALQGGVLGLMAGISTFKGMKYGPKSAKATRQALDLDAGNPYALAEHANMKLNAPPLFGGDKAEALEYYRASARAFESGPAIQRQGWYYPFVLASIGKALIEVEKPSEAVLHLEKVLQSFPRFTLISEQLLPQARKAADNN